jgi:GMP synthase (glutamine-hydrolysing)
MDAKQFIASKTEEIKNAVGGERALVALSGGVDSSVVAALSHRALGDRLTALFIDDGLMRADEAESVVAAFAPLGLQVQVLQAQNDFFRALAGLTDPEEKRVAFRDTFYRTLGDSVVKATAKFMLQGTIAADIIETQKGVKTQHNILEQIGIDPAQWGLRILEPLKELFKPQVREVGRVLGLPDSISERMPFPGPGLVCRVVGEVTPERVAIVRRATQIVEEELLDLRPFQILAVLLNDRATGLRNGERAFGDIIAVRCVNSQDAMTATAVNVPWDRLERICQRVTTELPSVTKVLYDLTPKPPSTIEYI